MARSSIFDSTYRDDNSPALHAESTFAFLNRVAGNYWDQPRALIEGWASNLKADGDYIQIRKAIRSKIDEQFRSAFFELYLHEMLLRGGFEIEIHPVVAGTNRRPDFLLTRGDSRFYVEAIAPGVRPEMQAKSQREGVVLDLLNATPSPNFLLSLRDFQSGARSPNTRSLRRELSKWLSGLDPDAPFDVGNAPVFTWSMDGWSIAAQAIPKKRDFRGKGGRSIGIYAANGGVVDDASKLRAAIGAKAGAYGHLDAPFVVAVGTYFFGSSERETEMALYGSDGLRLNLSDSTTERVRMSDGYFGAPPDWRHKGVSAVLTVNQLMPWSALQAQPVLWHHPDPDHPLDDLRLPVVEMVAGAHNVHEISPKSEVSTHFDFPADWPVGDPWP